MTVFTTCDSASTSTLLFLLAVACAVCRFFLFFFFSISFHLFSFLFIFFFFVFLFFSYFLFLIKHENSTPSLFACSESSYLKAYRDDKQRISAACSLSAVKRIQQISRSRQYSRRRSGAPRIDQIVDTNRSRRGVGAQLYIPHLLEIVARRPVFVRLALWFLHHPAWMESHTGGSRLTPHSTPVPSMTGEAVGGLRSSRAQSTTGRCGTRTFSYSLFHISSYFFLFFFLLAFLLIFLVFFLSLRF